MTVLELLAVLLAGLAGGAVNAVAGGGSLVTFPALLAVGLPPLTANVTNAAGMLPGYAAGVRGYRTLPTPAVRRGVAVTAGAALVGAAALLLAPDRAFELLVPWLVLGATALHAAAPRLSRRTSGGRGAPLGPALAACGAYAGYFGAALGVLLTAVLSTWGPPGVRDDAQVVNALKARLSLAAGLAGTPVLLLLGPVDVAAAVALAAGSAVGGTVGTGWARRLGPSTLRAAVLLSGTVAGVALLVRL